MLRIFTLIMITLGLASCSGQNDRPSDQTIQNLIVETVTTQHMYEDEFTFEDITHVASQNTGSEVSPEVTSRYSFELEPQLDFVHIVEELSVSGLDKAYPDIPVLEVLHAKGSTIKGEIVTSARKELDEWIVTIEDFKIPAIGEAKPLYDERGVEYVLSDDPELPALKAKYDERLGETLSKIAKEQEEEFKALPSLPTIPN